MAKGSDEKVSEKSTVPNGLCTQNLPFNDNVWDENTQEALNLLFVNDQQTYEEFLSSFLYLKKDEIMSSKTTQPSSSSITEAVYINTTSVSLNSRPEQVTAGCEINYDSNLQQEDLGHGDFIGSSTNRPKTLARLQLDNFVDDESLVGDGTGYCPSICEKISRINESDGHSTSCLSPPVDVDEDDSLKDRVILPGETELCEPTSVEVHLRSLNIYTKFSESSDSFYEDSSDSLRPGSVEESESSDVVSFTMDDDFDYDNVVVRPKFRFLSDKSKGKIRKEKKLREEKKLGKEKKRKLDNTESSAS